MPRHYDYARLLSALSPKNLAELCHSEGIDASIQKGTCSAQTQLVKRLALRYNRVDGGRSLGEVEELVGRLVEAGGGVGQKKMKKEKKKGARK